MGKPTTVTDGSEVLGGSGRIIASKKAIENIYKKHFCKWDRPEGTYRLTFTDGIVTWIEGR